MKALCLEHCIYLILQLADSDRQVENQLSHILQLALQQLNGLSLALVLWEQKDNKLSNYCTDTFTSLKWYVKVL